MPVLGGNYRGFTLGLLAVLVPAAAVLAWTTWRSSRAELEDEKRKARIANAGRRVLILYGTCTGTAKKFAYRTERHLQQHHGLGRVTTRVLNVQEYSEESLQSEEDVLFLCSTWTDGTAPESARAFLSFLEEYACDFRVSKDHLSKVRFAVFGLGGAIYGENFAKAARDAHEYLTRLGASALLPVHAGDDQSNLEAKFEAWCAAVVPLLGPQGSLTDGSSSLGRFEAAGGGVRNLPSSQMRPPKAPAASVRAKGQGNKGSNSSNPRGNAFQRQQLELKRGAPVTPSSTFVQPPAAGDCSSSTNGNSCGSGSGTGTGTGLSACAASSLLADLTGGDPEEEELELEEEDRINDAFVAMEGHGDGTGEDASYPSDGDGDSDSDDDRSDAGGAGGSQGEGVLDVEDLGAAIPSAQAQAEALAQASAANSERREMVTKLQRKALTKEGYRIIGTHSAVKLCRWTKAQVRGRGGCYKHSFYGITSYQCMEATPSLACANKCTFCWRHHKNPVGTEWRWKEDDPGMIVSEAVMLHQSMVNEMKGVPGALPERLREAMTVRHCALSLVGEPIMYPRINEMLRHLHDRDISTFMVTNAQFPDRIRQLDPVTQLYVSVDASTRESLKAIDRPLFKDFWERFLGSLKEMKAKQQRTVFRMTLVQGKNMNDDDELRGYAELVEMGQPDFIEIKAVTFCGKSDASDLTMKNVPWHKEVCAYAEQLAAMLAHRGFAPSRYSIATEHEHSCCILLAREDKFLVPAPAPAPASASGEVKRQWHTWIDYPRFQHLVRAYYDSGGKQTFSSTDYMAPTPNWALYQSQSRGFDPAENRFRKVRGGGLVEAEYKSSESGCG